MKESKIINGCKNRDRKCQKALVETYSPRLFTVARRYTRDDDSAKDILQEALILIFRNIEKYQPTGSFEGWMKRIVVTSSLKHLRDKDFWKNKIAVETGHFSPVPAAIYEKYDSEDIVALIRELPEGSRQIFNLYCIEGYNHNEIGEMLDIAPSASRSQLTRARQQLKKKLQTRNINAI